MFNTNKIQGLKNKSTAIMSIFTKTKEDLIAVNNEISAEESVRNTKIAALNAELSDLTTMKTENNKVIEKIDKFLA